MPTTLFQEGQGDPPRLARLYGVGVTTGILTYYEKRNGRTYFISLLAQGECDGIEKVFYKGFELPEFNGDGSRNWRFHRGTKSTGFADAEQGRPEFFPTFPTTLSRKAYIEVALSTELSDEDEPTSLKVIMRGARMWDYQYSADEGALVKVVPHIGSPVKIYSVNPALEFIDLAVEVGGVSLARFNRHADEWQAFKDRCAALIDWQGGNVAVAAVYAAVAGVIASGDGTLTNSNATGWVGVRTSTAIPASTVGAFSFKLDVGSAAVGLHTATPTSDASMYVAVGMSNNGVATLWRQGVSSPLGQWLPSDEYEFSADAGVLKLFKNGIEVDTSATPLPPASVDLYGAVAFYDSGAKIRRSRLLLTNTARQVPRYTGHFAFAGVDVPTALAALMIRCFGCDWYDANGGIGFYSTPNRPVVHRFTFDPTQTLTRSNQVRGKFNFSPKDAEALINYYRWEYRNLDDPLLMRAFDYTDRPLLREPPFSLPLNQSEIVSFGVANQSEVQRIGEAHARLLTDLGDKSFYVEGQADSYKVTKGSVVELSHDVAAYRESAPPQFLISEERFLPDSPDDRGFVLIPYDPAFYDDTAHGAIQQTVVGDVKSPFDPPPPVSSVALVEAGRALPDGTFLPVIRGTVSFNTSAQYPQRARVWWKKPTDASLVLTSITLYPNPATGQAGFELEGVTAGTHQVQVVTESLAGQRLSSNFHAVNSLVAVGNVTAPAPPASLSVAYDNARRLVRWYWSASPDNNIIAYQLTDEFGAVKFQGLALEYFEPPTAGTMTRRVYAINRAGIRSTLYSQATYTHGGAPAATSLALTLLSKAEPQGSTTSTVLGVVTFASFARNQTARLYVTEPASSERLTEIVLVPDSGGQATFSYLATSAGTYTFRVVTYDDGGFAAAPSGISNTVSVVALTVPPPTGYSLTFDQTTGELVHTWAMPSPRERVAAVQIATDAAFTNIIFNGDAVSFREKIGAAGTYTRYIRSVGNTGSTTSASVSASGVVPAPATPVAGTHTFNGEMVVWQFSAGDAQPVAFYEFDDGAGTIFGTPAQAPFLEPPVFGTASYSRRVRAVNRAGIRSGWLALSFTVPAPAAPTAGTHSYNDQVITWRWSAGDSTPLDSYEFDNGAGTTLAKPVAPSYDESPTYGTASYSRRVRAINRAGIPSAWAALSFTVPAPSAPSGYTLAALDADRLSHAWTGNANLEYEVWRTSDTSTTANRIWRGKASDYVETGFAVTSRSITRYLRALNNAGLASSLSTASATIAAPVAPTLTKDAARQYPTSLVVHVATTTPRSRIKATVVQVRSTAGAGQSFPSSTVAGTDRTFRYVGAPEEILIPYDAGGAMEYRVAHEDVFSPTLADYAWATQAHTFAQFLDSAIDSSSTFLKKASVREPIITGGGTFAFSAGGVPATANVASAANGGVASASDYTADNTYGAGLHTRPSDANDATRTLNQAASGTGYWRSNGLPAWWQVDFTTGGVAAAKTINRIDVYTMRDTYTDTTDPTSSETFTLFGATAYNLQYWDGSAWQNFTGASVSGNDKVLRSFVISPAVSTTKVRLNVTGGAGGVARICEVECYETTTPSSLLSWSDPIVIGGVPSTVFSGGTIQIPANVAGTALAVGEMLVARVYMANDATSPNTVSTFVVARTSYTAPAETATQFDIPLAVREPDGRVKLFDSRFLRAGDYLDAGTFIPRLVSLEAFLGTAQITFANIKTLTAAQLVAATGDIGLVFADVVNSRNFISSTSTASAGEINLGWLSVVNVAGASDGTLTKTAGGSAYNAGAVSARSLLYGDGSAEFTVASLAAFYVVGLSFGDNDQTLSDIDFAFAISTDGIARVVESGSVVQTLAAFVVGETYKITVESGVVKYYRRAAGGTSFVQVYTSTVAPRFPLLVDVSIYTSGATMPAVSLTGALGDTTQTQPRWANRVGVRLDASDQPYNVAGADGTNGATSADAFTGSMRYELTAPATGENFTTGLSQLSTNTSYANIDFGLNFQAGNFYIYESGVLKYSGGAYTAGDKFSITREGSTVKYGRNGSTFYTSTTALAVTTIMYLAFAANVTGSKLLAPRFARQYAKPVGYQLSTTGVAEVGDSAIIAGRRADAQAVRATGAIGSNLRYRGNDFGAFLVHKLDAVKLAKAKYALDGTGEVWFQLVVKYDNYSKDPYANADSVRFARCRVLNRFGDQIEDFGNAEFSFNGRGVAAWGWHSAKDADPATQAIYELRFWNEDEWSDPVYWQNGVTSLDPPAFANPLDVPTQVNAAAEGDDVVTLGWRLPVQNAGNEHLRYRRLGDAVWTDIDMSSSVFTGVTQTDLLADTWYQFQVTSGANESAIVLVKTKTSLDSFDLSNPSPSGLSLQIVSATSIRVYANRNTPSTNNADQVQIWRSTDGGAYALVTTVTYTGNNFTYVDTGVSAGHVYEYKLRNVWSAIPLASKFTNPRSVTITGAATTDPTGLVGAASVPTEAVLTWLNNAAAAGTAISVEWKVDDGTYSSGWTAIATGLTTPTATYTHTGRAGGVRYAYRVKLGSSNYSNVAVVTTPTQVKRDKDDPTRK